MEHEEFTCYKVCRFDQEGITSACISQRGWTVRYRVGKFVGRGDDFVGIGGLLAFDYLVPAIVFARFLDDKDHRIAVFRATGILPVDTELFRRRLTVNGRVTDELSKEGWPCGTVCYEQIRLDERIVWNDGT